MSHLLTALLTFAVIFPAELPDKSLLASLVLGTRFRSLPVWLGASAAFVVHVVLAVTAGGLLTLLPRTLVTVVVSVLFAAGALVLLFGKDEAPAPPVDVGAGAVTTKRMFWTSFGVVFVGEWGDITQLATANLAARYADPVAVGLGSAVALSSAVGLALLAGNTLLRRVPLGMVRRTAGVMLALLAVASALPLLP